MSAISSSLSTAIYGLNLASNRLAATSQKIASYGTGSPGSDDLAQNVVDLSTEKTDFQASAVLLKKADQTLGTLLDMFDTPKKK